MIDVHNNPIAKPVVRLLLDTPLCFGMGLNLSLDKNLNLKQKSDLRNGDLESNIHLKISGIKHESLNDLLDLSINNSLSANLKSRSYALNGILKL